MASDGEPLRDPSSGSVASNSTPYGGVTQDVLAALTDDGRNLIARGLGEGLGYKIIGFRVGRGGYNPAVPTEASPLVATDTELIDPFYPSVLLPPATIDRFEFPNDAAASFLCRVPSSEAIAGLGEIGLYAEVTVSPSDPTEVGDVYLFAHAHRPLHAKTLQDVLVWRLVVQF